MAQVEQVEQSEQNEQNEQSAPESGPSPDAASEQAPVQTPDRAADALRPVALLLLVFAVALAAVGQYLFSRDSAEPPLQAVLAFAVASGCLFIAARLVGLAGVPRDDE